MKALEDQVMHGFVLVDEVEREVTLLYQGDGKPCYLRVALPRLDIVQIDDVFPNPVVASAFLRSELSYGPAVEFLHLHQVPKTSQLWHLNHSIIRRRPGPSGPG